MAQARRIETETKTNMPDPIVPAEAQTAPLLSPAPSSDTLTVAFEEAAHIGKRKKEQQDAHGHLHLPAEASSTRPACYLFVVADGVSMGQAGALASRTAVDVTLEKFQKTVEGGQTDLALALAQAVAAANAEVCRLAKSRPGMATTCVAALVVGSQLITAHMGDSRAYLLRPNLAFLPVTVDHSWVAEMGEVMVQQGLMSRQDLARDNRRHTITRAFGLQEKMSFDVNAAQLEPGDLVILCSDGLWDVLTPNSLENSCREGVADLPALSRKLVDAALETGGRDNITVVLARFDAAAPPLTFPSLDPMLERTAQELAERTRPLITDQSRKNTLVVSAMPPVPASGGPKVPTKDYQPLGVVDKADDENALIEDLPSLKLPTLSPDMLLARAQKSFALGDWDEAIGHYTELETTQASYHGLYESFSAALIRYIGTAIGEGRVEKAEALVKHLESQSINRYTELLADYCNEESRRAALAHHYPAAKAYSLFCLRLRPGDVHARTQAELSDLYNALQRPKASLSERLALAQKIYARDGDFGGIQDDLARIYMELGDEAVRTRSLEDAASWYSMIMPLRTKDSHLLSLASNKARSVQDDLARRGPVATRGVQAIGPSRPAGTASSEAAMHALDREREHAASDGRPEQELVNRLKERVSRAQKAWDNGRKEVGSEYIYLVDQLNDLLPLNPWQQTFPRVCYDYARWLLEQKQYEEARPYFVKAQGLGMAAAQQRLKEIDRIIKERQPRGSSPADLPDENARLAYDRDRSAQPLSSQSAADRLSQNTADRPSTLTNTASLFTGRRSTSNATGPIVPPPPAPPSAGTFVGATHAGDGVLTPNRATAPSGPAPMPGGPRSAATVASGNWKGAEAGIIPPTDSSTQLEIQGSLDLAQSEVASVPMSGTLRHNFVAQSGDPLQEAASREVNRLAGTGQPQSVDPRRASRRRWAGRASLLRGLALPLIGAVVVILAVAVVVLVVLPKIGQKGSAPDLAVTSSAALNNTPSIISETPTNPPLTGVQGVVRVEGAKPDDLVLFLATVGDPNSPYREFSQEGNFFYLPTATLNRLDPRQKYVVVVRPKDTAERKYAENLGPENPAQRPFTYPDLSYDAARGFEVTMKISPESLAFYPLRGGTTDSDVPGGRLIAMTKHSIRNDYLKYYNANGGLGRFGFPLSEEFDWGTSGRVQFFERGWLAVEGPGKPVTVGQIGKAILGSTCSGIPRQGASATPIATPTLKTDPDFAATVTSLKLGVPQSPAFEIANGAAKIKVQYFEFGRLEQNSADKKVPPGLGLLGVEYARCLGWLS